MGGGHRERENSGGTDGSVYVHEGRSGKVKNREGMRLWLIYMESVKLFEGVEKKHTLLATRQCSCKRCCSDHAFVCMRGSQNCSESVGCKGVATNVVASVAASVWLQMRGCKRVAASVWLQARGCKWLQARGCKRVAERGRTRVAAMAWLQARGCMPVAAMAWLQTASVRLQACG